MSVHFSLNWLYPQRKLGCDCDSVYMFIFVLTSSGMYLSQLCLPIVMVYIGMVTDICG